MAVSLRYQDSWPLRFLQPHQVAALQSIFVGHLAAECVSLGSEEVPGVVGRGVQTVVGHGPV